MTDKLNTLFQPRDDVGGFYKAYNDTLLRYLSSLDIAALEALITGFLTARKEGKTIFFAGNGGSAATASHFAQDLATVGRKAGVATFKTLSLTDNTSYITALANDLGYDRIFSEQMQPLFQSGDLLVAISASGNSPNILKAAELAKERGGTLFALVGFDGGALAKLADHCLLIKTPKGAYGPVEDAHMIIDHLVTGYLVDLLKEPS
ncbi:MAG: SIS domain-containing protein [Magnetococcales bacterium]|nr:SIS domain-containing protein [Magnetococcales bacterium]